MTLIFHICLGLIGGVISRGRLCYALTTPLVRPLRIAAHEELVSLANLRYDEWILPYYPDTSRESFQRATAEICRERAAQGAVVFLASRPDDERLTLMGAGELSPIEVQGTLIPSFDKSCEVPSNEHVSSGILYMTDLVTATVFRRQGVAKAIMNAVEEHARRMGSSWILLHVKPDNKQASTFYTMLGYSESLDFPVDGTRLEENAGTKGQVVMGKRLFPVSLPAQQRKRRKRQRSGVGFG